MPAPEQPSTPQATVVVGVVVRVVVGVDGAGRSFRLQQLAAGAGSWVRVSSPGQLAAASPQAGLLVDDAHRLDEATLQALTRAARDGAGVLLARRPGIGSAALADLDSELADRGGVEVLRPLDLNSAAGLIEAATGRVPEPAEAEQIRVESGGLPAIAVLLATYPGEGPPPGLTARVQRQLAAAGPDAARLAEVLAPAVPLPDGALARLAGVEAERLGGLVRTLRELGLLEADGERLIPAVAAAVLAELTGAERRLLTSRLYRVAAEAARFTDPEQAVAWYDGTGHGVGQGIGHAGGVGVGHGVGVGVADADAGGGPVTSAGHAEALVLLGRPVPDADPLHADPLPSDSLPSDPPARSGSAPEDRDGAARLALARAVAAAQQGRPGRAAEILLGSPTPHPLGPALAVPLLFTAGRPGAPDGGPAAATPTYAVPRWAAALTEAAARFATPPAALPPLIEAAEGLEHSGPAVLLPDTPHALSAAIAVAAADPGTAERLLSSAIGHRLGGPAGQVRHRLLLAWVRLRRGRYDTAVAEIRRTPIRTPATDPRTADPRTAALPPRDRLLRVGLAAAVARRSGDVQAMRQAWDQAEPELARRTIDLLAVELIEELMVTAARLRQLARTRDHLQELRGAVLSVGGWWPSSMAWLDLQIAVVTEDADAAGRAAEEAVRASESAGGTGGDSLITGGVVGGVASAGDSRPRQLAAAATAWAAALAGDVDADGVLAATDGLLAAQLPWEAARLAGQAGIRTDRPTDARRLLERARELSGADPTDLGNPASDSPTALSDREVAVARLVLAGGTHREIGAQLFIAPKTVEHHVARIRGKLGATSRADFVAALRRALDEPPQTW